jgi:ABC-type dipeptide/oligopeptide/nickel transport system permease component
MDWQTCIAEKTVGALRRFGHVLASIAAYRRPRRWADFAVMALLAAGISLVSMWAGAVILFIAVALFVRREVPAQSFHQNGQVGSDTWLKEDLDDYSAGV